MNTISVVIPAYNSGRTIADCIHSIMIQTQQPAFVIVVNDCSTDRTKEIAENLGVFVKSNPRRIGKGASINSALEFIHTDYVLTLDSDTYLEREFIQKMAKALDSKKYDAGSGMVNYIGKNTYAKKVAKRWHNRTWKYNGCCQFFRTSLIKKLRFDETTYVEDEEIYNRVKNMKTGMVNAWVYTEVTQSEQQYFNQSLRWLRGDAQLALRNKDVSRLGMMMILAIIPMALFWGIFYFRHDLKMCVYSAGLLPTWGLVVSNYSLDPKIVLKSMFVNTFVFIEMIILRSRMNLDNWEREVPEN